MALALCQFGLEQQHLILRDDRFFLEQLLGVIVLQFREPGLGHLGVQLCLVKSWYDLEHHIALLHRLALLDRDLLEIPALQGTDLDVALRVDLADILLGDDDVLCLGAGDHDLMVLLVGLLLVLVKIRLILADDVPFHLLDARANVIKIGVNFRRVERRKDIRPIVFDNPRTPPLTSATTSIRVVTGRRMAKTIGFIAQTPT